MGVLARDRRDLLARGVGIFDHGVTRAAADIAVVKLALDLAVDAGQLVERVPIGTRDRILAAGADLMDFDRKSAAQGTSVSVCFDLGCRRIIKKTKHTLYIYIIH